MTGQNLYKRKNNPLAIRGGTNELCRSLRQTEKEGVGGNKAGGRHQVHLVMGKKGSGSVPLVLAVRNKIGDTNSYI